MTPSTKKGNTKVGKREKLVLLDVHAIIHRAYHALPDFASARGEPTGALYGLCTMLLKIVGELKPDYIAACFDLPEKTHRHDAYEGYKAKRKKIDDELVAQIIRSRDIFLAFNIPIYECPGFEADDLLGTIAEKMKDEDLDVVIASGDMDTLQLVDDKRVQVYTLRKGIKDTVLYDEKAVLERFGFGPKLLPDFKGLRGDPSDNIVGIAGIGEKTATTLISKFGSIEDMYRALKKDRAKFEEAGVKPRMIELLLAGEEEAIFSKTLATIRRDAPIEFSLPAQQWEASVDLAPLEKLFAELDFKSLFARVEEMFGPKQASFTDGGDAAAVGATGAASAADAARTFPPLSPRDEKLTCIALWIIDSSISNPSIEDALRFAHTDSPMKAKEMIFAELEKRGLMKVFREIEEPLVDVVEAMQERGVKIDTEYLKELSSQYHKQLAALEKNIYREAGEEFNINSPKQMGVILFDKLGLKLKSHKKTSLGVKSTRESELEKMRDLHPIIEYLLEYRVLQKLLSTYIDNIPTMLGSDGRLHPTFLQAGTTTGRMSSQDPNIQNIPIKTEEGRRIRNAFVAEKGFKFVAFDYSQIELRVAAFISGDKKLIDIFKSGGDVHEAVASAVFHVSKDQVDREMRRRAKVINFGIIYGMGVNALRTNLGTSRDEAQKFYEEYFKNFTGLAQYLDDTKEYAKKFGYTETFFGRRRYFPNIKSKQQFIQAANERMATNAPLQGTAADIIKIAMVRIHQFLKEKKLSNDVFMLMQVHDELVFEVRDSVVDTVLPELQKLMQGVLKPEEMKGVPLVVNGEIGDNWGETKSL